MSSDRGELRAPISNIVPQPDKKTNCTKVLSGGATWGGQTRNPQPQSGIGFASYCNDDREGSKILFERGPVNNGSDPGSGEVMADSSKTTAESRRRPGRCGRHALLNLPAASRLPFRAGRTSPRALSVRR